MSSQPANQIPRAFLYFARFILIGLFLAITMLQLFSFPGQFRYEASNGQGSQSARWFLTIMVGFWFLIAQFSIIALWKVLTRIYYRTLRSTRGKQSLNILVASLATGAGYGVAVTSIALIFADDPGPVVVTGTLTAFIFALFIVGYFFRFHALSDDTQ